MKIYVNLPVKDLHRAMAFFGQLGFTFNPSYTDDNATAMVISDDIYVMLLVEPFFKTFIHKDLADASKTTGAILSLEVEDRARVDDLMERALAAGARQARDLPGMETMYGRSFEDPDGHQWEIFCMEEPGD